ncbi:MAG: DUF1573 domain-containing protein [Phycisphaerales bacterium]|nr:DUF1573 domain-containing protein [Phycisphaerales bacterium]
MLVLGLATGALFLSAGCDQQPAKTAASQDKNTLPAAHKEVDAAPEQHAAAPQATPQAKPPATQVPINPSRPTPTPGAKLVFDTLIYDFGTVYTDGPLEGIYNFKNEGTADLMITRVKPGCGCTSANAAELENTTYKPGDGGQIRFTFSPKGHGVQNKNITVMSTSEDQTTVYLQLRANVLPSVKLMNQAAQFGTIQAGTQGVATIQLQSRDEDFRVESVELPSDTNLTWTFERLNVAPEAEYKGVGQIVFKSNLLAPTGPISEQATIKVYAKVPETDKTESTFTAVIGGNILAKFEFEPRFLRFPTASPGDKVEARTIISHLEGQAFKIDHIDFDKEGKPGDDFTVTYQEVAGSDGKMHEIVLSGTCPPVGRSFRGALYVYTDVKDHGPVTLRYNGIIRPLRGGATGGAPR